MKNNRKNVDNLDGDGASNDIREARRWLREARRWLREIDSLYPLARYLRKGIVEFDGLKASESREGLGRFEKKAER